MNSIPTPADFVKHRLAAQQMQERAEQARMDEIVALEKKLEAATPPKDKKPFIRKPHLTTRPFAESDEMKALRDSLPQNRRQNHKGGRPPKHAKKAS